MGTPFRIVLASASPRRRELLGLAGVPFRVVPSRAEEVPLPGERPRAFALRAARDKGDEVAARLPSAWVLSADTVVAAGGAILGKPADRAEARSMIALLQGREHRVHTALSLQCRARGYRDEAVETTRVRFRPLCDAEVEGYAATGEGDDKAGAYAVQGMGALLVESLHGSFTNVVGLPLAAVMELLARAGIARVAPAAAARRGAGWHDFGEPGR